MSTQPETRSIADRAQEIIRASRDALAAQQLYERAEDEVRHLRPRWEKSLQDRTEAAERLAIAEAGLIVAAQEAIQFNGAMPDIPAKYRDRITRMAQAPTPPPVPVPTPPAAPAVAKAGASTK